MGRLPIRWRLTLWYGGVLTGALLLFGVGLYVALRVRLHTAFDDQLRAQAAVTLASVRIENQELSLATDGGAPARADEHFVRLLDERGQVIDDSSATVGGVPLDHREVEAALVGRVSLASWRVEGETLRVITIPIRRDGEGSGVVGVLQVGLFRSEIDEALDEVVAALGLALPLVLLVAGAGGYLLASRALAPVAAITKLAASVGGGALDSRLNLDLPDDELGRLASTFDGMLMRIEDAFERQRRFTGDAAHELRTPLSLLRSQVDLALARSRSAEEYREALRGLDGDLARMTDLMSTLLTLARTDDDRLPVEYAPLDLAETIAIVLEQFDSRAAGAGITLRNESAPTPLLGDEDLLVQVLVNLVDNALDHTPAGGTVAIGCGEVEGEVRLWIADTGVGIAPEHQGRVFDRFYRLDSGRTRSTGGAGLGLAISRAIAEAHGGTISLTSRVGKGTRVELVLPTHPVATTSFPTASGDTSGAPVVGASR
jgi:heavy metal sensor kinase